MLPSHIPNHIPYTIELNEICSARHIMTYCDTTDEMQMERELKKGLKITAKQL